MSARQPAAPAPAPAPAPGAHSRTCTVEGSQPALSIPGILLSTVSFAKAGSIELMIVSGDGVAAFANTAIAMQVVVAITIVGRVVLCSILHLFHYQVRTGIGYT